MSILTAESATHWDWAQTIALIAPVTTLVGAVITVAATYSLNQRAARRDRQAEAFAEALTAIEDYAQMPYSIRRRGTPEDRTAISSELNRIQSRIAFQHAWLHIEAPAVATAYTDLIRAVRGEAGQQMKDAWSQRPATDDEQMTLEAYPRDRIDAARSQCIAVMRAALGRNRGAEEPATGRSLPR